MVPIDGHSNAWRKMVAPFSLLLRCANELLSIGRHQQVKSLLKEFFGARKRNCKENNRDGESLVIWKAAIKKYDNDANPMYLSRADGSWKKEEKLE